MRRETGTKVTRGRLSARDTALLTAAAAVSWPLAELATPPDVDAAVIPTLVGVVAVKFFKRDKGEGELEPKHPAVKFLLRAWNERDFGEAEKYVAPGCVLYMNGFDYDPGIETDGPAMVKESLEYWRSVVPDLEMELSREIREKDQIAIEWLITGTHTGERPELPPSGNAIEIWGSAFLTLEDDRIVEVRTFFDALAFAVQTGAAEAPAWWPGRSQEDAG